MQDISGIKRDALKINEKRWDLGVSEFLQLQKCADHVKSLDLGVGPDNEQNTVFGQVWSVSGRYWPLAEHFEHVVAPEELILQGCKNVKELPNSFGKLSALKKLDMGSMDALTALPATFGALSKLEELNLEDCGSLKDLPASFRNLTELKKLDKRSAALTALPEDFGALSKREKLNMSDLTVTALPASFGNLSKLEELEMVFCRALRELPTSFGNLSALQTLDMDTMHKPHQDLAQKVQTADVTTPTAAASREIMSPQRSKQADDLARQVRDLQSRVPKEGLVSETIMYPMKTTSHSWRNPSRTSVSASFPACNAAKGLCNPGL